MPQFRKVGKAALGQNAEFGKALLGRALLAVLLAGAVLVGLPTSTAFAQDDADPLTTLENELDTLRDEVEQLRREEEEAAKRGERKRPTVDGEGLRFADMWGLDAYATFQDTFELNFVDPYEADAERQVVHRLGFHGRLHFDYVWTTDKKHPTHDTFDMRRIRLESEGFFYRNLEYRIAVDFAEDSDSTLRHAFVNLHYWDAFQARIGHQKVPIGMEWIVDSNYLNFAERPMIFNTMGVEYDLGAAIHGDATFANYSIGVYNGNGANNTDDSDSKALAVRLQLTPFKAEEGSDLQDTALGASFTTGHANNFIPEFETQAGTVWLDPGPLFQQGQLSRVSGEFMIGGGPLRLQAEYFYLRVADVSGDPAGLSGILPGEEADLSVHGFYVDLMYMLTGERRRYNQRVQPFENFDPSEGTWGAFELGARVERTDVESEVQRKSLRGTDECESFTLGLNWYLNPNVRFTANYQRVFWDDQINVDRIEKNEDIVFFRIGVEF